MAGKIIVRLIKIYRKLSNYIPKKCRYYPTCSEYAIMAIEKHGTIYGIIITIKRLLKCNQFFEGGYDPIK